MSRQLAYNLNSRAQLRKIVVVVPERGKVRIGKPNRATLQHIIDQGSQYRGKLHAKTRYTRPN